MKVEYLTSIIVSSFLIFCACTRSNKNVTGFLVSPNREDRNQYLANYPNQIDSAILDTFEGIAYYVIDSESHTATFVVTKKYKIMLAIFP